MTLNELRQKAEADFKANGFPTTKEELWRFTDVSRVAEAEFTSAWKPSDVEYDALSPMVAVFENGKLSSGKSSLANLPDGITIQSILDRADERIGSLADSQSAFVASNTAYFSDGVYIEIADGVELEAPIHLIYLADVEGAAFHLRNFISAGENTQVTIVDSHHGER